MQGKVLKRVVAVGAALVGLVFAVPALAQESITEFTSLEPIESIITNFESGLPTEGLTIVADDADAAIRSQFQIMINFAPDPVFAEEDVAFTPSGFVEGSTTAIESVAQYFDPPDEMRFLPPLHPWIDPYSRVAIAAGLDGWTVYGEDGLIEGVEDAFDALQSVWGVELAEPFDTTCSQTAFVGRAWEGASITTGPDPLFTTSALNSRYGGDSHKALADTASRIVELSCFPGGEPTVFQYRMKEGSGIRPFGPTGTIAMVKGTSVVFFNPVRILDGDVRQQFFATPADGGPVETTIIEEEPKLLVPNPYAEFNTKVTIVPIDETASDAASDTANGQRLLHGLEDDTAIRTQSGGGCQPRSEVIFVDGLIGGAITAGFANKDSLVAVNTDDEDIDVQIHYPDGSKQIVRWVSVDDNLGSPGTWEVEMIQSSGSSCTTAVELMSGGNLVTPNTDGETENPIDDTSTGGSTPPDSEPAAPEDGSSSSASIPWVPVGLVIVGLGGGVYAYTRTRKKPTIAPQPPTAAPPIDTPDGGITPPPVPPPAPASQPETPTGPRTFTAEDRAALQEVYKGADEAGLKVVGISEITRLEDVLAGSKDNPVVIGKATKIEVGVTDDGSLVSADDEAATSTLSVEVIPSLELDSKDEEHIVWRAYTKETDTATGTEKTTRTGPSSSEWEAKIDGRSDAEVGNDPAFKDWIIETTPDNPSDAVRQALSKRG
jgi:hypothetical protein